MRPSTSRRRLLAAALAAMAAPTMAGCWGTGQAHAVDPPRAREALKGALDHWKGGRDPGSLESSTSMTIQDPDWAGGARLVDYRILDDGQARDANLAVRVRLVLEGVGKKAGKPVEKSVWYLVGTSPSVTVFRDSLRR